MPKVSIIIPVYNAKDYLKRCLDSVSNQTLKDIEIICINDASTDNSIEILKQYKRKDARVKIMDCKENGGESVARNIGLDNATGMYIAFLDNDDTVDMDFYEKLFKKAMERSYDIIKANVRTINYDGNVTESLLNPKISATNNKWYFHYEWWSAIFNAEFLKKNDIRLLEGFQLGGDSLFLNEAIHKCQRFYCINDTYYNYFRRRESGDSLELSSIKISSSLNIFTKIFNNLNFYYKNNEINSEVYLYLCKNYIDLSIFYIFRTKSQKAKENCIDYLMATISNCLLKDMILIYLQTNFSCIYYYIKYNNISGLKTFVCKLDTLEAFYKANILYRLRFNVIRK